MLIINRPSDLAAALSAAPRQVGARALCALSVDDLRVAWAAEDDTGVLVLRCPPPSA